MTFGKKQYIEIKDGNNKPLIIGMIIVIILLALLFTSKLWLPDNRPMMTYDKDEVLIFSLCDVTLPKEVYYDEKKNLLEFKIRQKKQSMEKAFDLKMKVSLEEDEMELPFEEIKGNFKSVEVDDVTKEQLELVQILVPDDWYYVTVTILQKDTVSQSFTIDYRDVKHKSISDKEQNYIKNMEIADSKFSETQKDLKHLQDTFETNVAKIKDLDTQIVKAKDNKVKKSLSLQRDKLTKENDEIQKQIDIDKNKIETYKEQVKVFNDL